MRRIHARNLPLCTAFWHLIALIIIDRSSPEVRLRNFFDHLFTCVAVGYKPSVQYREQYVKILTFHTYIMLAADYADRSDTGLFLFFHCIYILTECHFMACRSPYRLLFQPERYGDRIFARYSLRPYRKIICLFTQRLYISCQVLLPDLHAISGYCHYTRKRIRIHEQILVDNLHLFCGYFGCNILIVELYFLHLRGRFSVSSIRNAVRTEIVVRRPLVKISAICLEFIAVPILLADSLIDIIPDKSALIKRFCICQVSIFMHRAAGISHSMCVLAADKRLAAVFCKEFFD